MVESDRRGARFRFGHVIDAACIVAIGGALTVLIRAPGERPGPVHLPALGITIDKEGTRHSRVDQAALERACELMALPAPPELNGIDPVPIERLMGAITSWNETRAVSDLGDMGRVCLALGLHAAALEYFAAAANLAPRSGEWAYLAGVCCQSLAQNDAAQSMLLRARALEPDYPITIARLARLALERGDLDAAERLYHEYVALRPDSLGYAGLGQATLARGDAVAAESFLERAVRSAANDVQAWRLYARALALNGKVDQSQRASAIATSLPEYRGWLTFDPRLKQAHALAQTQQSLENELRVAQMANDIPTALRAAQALLARRPNSPQLKGTLAGLHHLAGDSERARDMIARAIASHPDVAALRLMQAELLLSLSDYPAAATAVDALLRMQPESARAHDLKGRLLFIGGDRTTAIAMLRRSLELDPQADAASIALISMLLEMDRRSEAIAVLRQRVQLNPAADWAREKLRELETQP